MTGPGVGTVRDPASLRQLQAVADGMEASDINTAVVDLKDGRAMTIVLTEFQS